MGDGRVTDAAAAMTSAEEMIERRIFFFSFLRAAVYKTRKTSCI